MWLLCCGGLKGGKGSGVKGFVVLKGFGVDTFWRVWSDFFFVASSGSCCLRCEDGFVMLFELMKVCGCCVVVV